MKFTPIKSIDDILPSVEGRKDFTIADKGDYIVIDYLFTQPDTFEDSLRLECRGLKFQKNGQILSRPFHKFFNIGEKEQPEEIDFTRPHHIMEKLDGSMIHPAKVGKDIILMTRMGTTDVAQKVTPFLDKSNYYNMMNVYLNLGMTPIFEYTAPDNRIVLKYPNPELTLLAIRDNYSGNYMDPEKLKLVAFTSNIPLVTHHDFSVGRVREFLENVRILTDREGYVIKFHDGHMLKAKASEYLLKHRTLDGLSQKKNVIALVVNQLVDDTTPILSPEDAEELTHFANELNAEILRLSADLGNFVASNSHDSRKNFATRKVPTLPDYLRPCAFKVLDGHPPLGVIKDLYMRRPDITSIKWRDQ